MSTEDDTGAGKRARRVVRSGSTREAGADGADPGARRVFDVRAPRSQPPESKPRAERVEPPRRPPGRIERSERPPRAPAVEAPRPAPKPTPEPPAAKPSAREAARPQATAKPPVAAQPVPPPPRQEAPLPPLRPLSPPRKKKPPRTAKEALAEQVRARASKSARPRGGPRPEPELPLDDDAGEETASSADEPARGAPAKRGFWSKLVALFRPSSR